MLNVITYSGSKCNSYLYLTFYAEVFDINKVSDVLKMTPSYTKIKGEKVPINTSWNFRIEVGNDVDLVKPLNQLIKLFEPKVYEINKLKNELGLSSRLQFVIDIDIHPESSTPYFSFNQSVIKFLFETETIVGFDLYKSDTIGVIDENFKFKE